MILLSLLACDCAPLEQADIRGGTDEEQRTIREAVGAFVAAVGSDRVCVPHVSIREVGRGEGRYNTVSRGIRVDPGLELETLRGHVWHELCHAVDVQEDVSDREPELWVFDDPDVAEEYGRRLEQREAFAFVCQAGPLGIQLLASDDCGEPDRFHDAVATVATEVYVDPPETGSRAAWAPAVMVSLDGLLVGASELSLLPSVNDDLLLFVEGSDAVTVFDPYTGEASARAMPAEVLWSPVEEVVHGFELVQGVGSAPEGPLAQAMRPALAPFPGLVAEPRVLIYDGLWSAADEPCLDGRTLFTLGGELWAWRYDRPTRRLEWGRFGGSR